MRTSGGRHLAVTLALAALAVLTPALAGCMPLASSTVSSTVSSAAAPPLVSQPPASAVVARTAAALEGAYRQAGFAFIPARRPYRPSEPPALILAPRSVYQVVLPKDPGSGYVVIYQAADPAAAQSLATAMQRYLGSGFGETNFPTDARFAVQAYDATVVFGWYSPGASADPAAAAAALRVLRSFGEPFPVVR